MNLSLKVMRGIIAKLWLVVGTLLGCVWGGEVCSRGSSWWDRQAGECVPCTRCDPVRRLAVRFPCELHRDTICQPLSQLHIFPFTPRRPNNDNNSEKSAGDYEYYEDADYEVEVTDVKVDEVKWDLLTVNLTLAASGCVVFFIVVLSLALYHTKQWRVLKQALKSDVQDLTAKLKLMEAGGDTPAEPAANNDHHIYCNIHVGKETLLGPSAKKGLGNVYTQEMHQP